MHNLCARWSNRTMLKAFLGLIVGPLMLIGLGFLLFGAWGAVLGFFVIVAAVVFVPILAIAAAIGGPSLLVLVPVANAIPLSFYVLNCAGRACPNYTFAAVAPQYLGATFCAVVFWLFASAR